MHVKKQFLEFLETAVVVSALSQETEKNLIDALFYDGSRMSEKIFYDRLCNEVVYLPWSADMYVTTEWLWRAFKQYKERKKEDDNMSKLAN